MCPAVWYIQYFLIINKTLACNFCREVDAAALVPLVTAGTEWSVPLPPAPASPPPVIPSLSAMTTHVRLIHC